MFLKTKTKSYGKEVKVGSNNNCLAVISLKMKALTCRCFYFRESIYIEKKVIRHNIDDLESSFDHSDEELKFFINTEVGCFLRYLS